MSTTPELTRVAASGPPKGLDLSPSVIRSTITAADAGPSVPRGAFTPQPVTSQARTDRAFQAAQIEGCMSDGALKFDPLPVWGDFVMGVLAVPYTLHAMATGRCKLLSK